MIRHGAQTFSYAGYDTIDSVGLCLSVLLHTELAARPLRDRYGAYSELIPCWPERLERAELQWRCIKSFAV